MIDPGTKEGGEEYMAYNRRRWGSDGWTHSMRAKGAKVGAPFADWKTWPNTLKAHRLMYFGGEEYANALKGALFDACYERGENISDVECLAVVASRVGLEAAAARAYLLSDQGKTEVAAECQSASRSGVTGVPYFIVDGDHVERPYGFSGAVDSGSLLNVFNEVSGREAN